MKLISLDIGLRNLAFCVLEGTNRSNLKITHWDLIDVMAESAGHESPKCFKCKKPANWLKGGDVVYACTVHKPKGQTKGRTKTSLNKMKTEDLRELGTHCGIVDSVKTKKELVELIYRYSTMNVWKRCVKSTKSVSVVDLAGPIAQCLEARKNIWKGADLVALEQQPDKRMLCVQSMIHMWFVCNKYKCKGVSAVHKLTNIITIDDATKTYKGRKKTGIVHAEELLPTAELKTFMLKHPKKDDLCDAFLQGLWVMEHC